jgi:hypothetical protein
MGNLYHNSGNVGIGTTVPLVPLDVHGGSVRVSTSGTFEQSVAFSSGIGGWARGLYWVDGTATDSFSGLAGGLAMSGSGSTPARLSIGWGPSPHTTPQGIHLLTNGNFGVGTIAPTARLDVNGGVNISGVLTVNETSGFTASGEIKCTNIQFTDTAPLIQGVTIGSHTAGTGPRYASANFGDYVISPATINYTAAVIQYGKLVVLQGLISNLSTASSAAGTAMIKGLPPPIVYNLFYGLGPTNNTTIGRFDINTSGDLVVGFAWTGAARNAASGAAPNWLCINCCYLTA